MLKELKINLTNMFMVLLPSGSMKYIAFIMDPDGYWIEIVSSKEIAAGLSKK